MKTSFWGINRTYSEIRVAFKESTGGWQYHHLVRLDIDQYGDVYANNGSTKCGGEALDAAKSGFKVASKYSIKKDFNQKINASNKGGAANILQADFVWVGFTTNLKIY